MADTSLIFTIFGRDRTGPAFNSASSGASKLGSGLKKGLGVAALGAAGAVAGVGAALVGFIGEARESAKIGRLTEAVVKSTGGAANVTADQVGKLAGAISNKTGVDDEAIQSGSNLLLTFTKVRNEVGKGNDIFDQANQAVVDMTAAMNNGDVSAEKIKGSSIMLGKALNDPIKGVTALSRAGVSFTEQQKDQIKTLVESGDTLGAQKVILAEMQTQFGGAAAAAADPLSRLQTIAGNLGEDIGGLLLPVVEKLATFIGDKVAPAIQSLIGKFQGGGAGASKMAGVWKAVSGFIQNDFLPVAMRVGRWFMNDALPAIRAFAAKLWSDLQPAIRQIAKSFNNDIKPALVSLIGKFREAWPTVQRVLSILGKLAGFILRNVAPVIIKFYAKYLSALIRVVGKVIGIAAKFIGKLIDVGAGVGRAGKKVWNFATDVKNAIGGAFTWVRTKVGGIVDFFQGLPGKISRATGGMFDGIKDALRSALNWVIGKWNNFSITVDIPDIIPGLPNEFTLSTPNIPYMAKGGTITQSGMAVVGEAGPELLSMPRGAQVTPLSGGGMGGVVRVVIDLIGADAELKRRIQKMVRVEGRGDVQVAFGR